jgi:hypothetical protein
MPFWVWLAFQEVPPNTALVGGALVMGAVFTDIVGDLHRKEPKAMRQPRSAPGPAKVAPRSGSPGVRPSS